MNNSYNGHLCIVFALEHYNPLNMIRAFGENGINPVYISVKRRYETACLSKYISKLHRVGLVEEGYELLMNTYGNVAVETGKKPYIVFSDDKSVGYFDLHYDEWKDKFITYNAGRAGRINEFMDKYEIQQLAKKHGFNVLDRKTRCRKVCGIQLSRRIFRQTQATGRTTFLFAGTNRS